MQKVGSVTHTNSYWYVAVRLRATAVKGFSAARGRALFIAFARAQCGRAGTRPTIRRMGIPPFVVRAASRRGIPSWRSSS